MLGAFNLRNNSYFSGKIGKKDQILMITIAEWEFLVSESTAMAVDLNDNSGILFPFAVKFFAWCVDLISGFC